METNNKRIVVSFHIGRGGHFNNQGHLSFIDECNFQEVLSRHDSNGDIFYWDEDEEGNPLERPYYTDCDGNVLVEGDECEDEVGRLSIDGEYNTDYSVYLDDCDTEELAAIAESASYLSDEVVDYLKEYSKYDSDIEDILIERGIIEED